MTATVERPGASTARARRCGRPRAVGVDYDGTLTEGARPAPAVLAAIARARADGIAVVLVTGRIRAELLADFADVADHFDALVVENGAEIDIGGRRITTAPPVGPALSGALAARGIRHRRGSLIIAASGSDEHAIVDEVASAGLECQLVHNRGELMILPAGVNKGLGFASALAELGISPHDAVAVGDAENDHSLLAAAELGVAVGNAVASLRSVADVVLEQADGDGVATLLDDLAGAGVLWRRRRRPQIVLGHDAVGEAVCVAAHPGNILVTGGSGDGKSYVAGLIAEQLVDLAYSVLVVDPEGDHVGLDTLRPVVVLGDDAPPPPAGVVADLMERSDACVVVDLSQLAPPERERYLAALPATIEAGRREHGRPHWVIVDEAHHGFVDGASIVDLASSGYCLVTWRPQDLPNSTVAAIDVVVALTTPNPDPAVVDITAAVAGEPRAAIAELLTQPTGGLVVVRRDRQRGPRRARVAARRTSHFRHEHKYDVEGTSVQRGFWFRDDHDRPTGRVARSLHELAVELAGCPAGVIRHHAPLGDISRWIESVFHDRRLALVVTRIESQLTAASSDGAVDAARLELVRAIHRRHHVAADAGTGGRR